MIKERLQIVFSKEEISRITLISNADELRIVADVHGMKCYQARRFINNIINLIRTSFKLIIIHGYNHGTAIKDMLSDNFTNAHVFLKCTDPCNQGITCMQIA